jgi:serine/threonine protein kinase
MAKVIAVGAPVNDAERQAIAYLRDHLPEGYTLLHNFEIQRGGELFEIDLAVLAPHALYLVDVKGTRGLIDVYGSKWHPQGRQPFTSPLLKLRGHARTLKGVIQASQPARQDLDSVYVDAAIILTAPDASLLDPGGRDGPAVTPLAHAPVFFQNSGRIPGQFSKAISPLHNMILGALQAKAKPATGPERFGAWEVLERLGATEVYTEYRAKNSLAGGKSGTVLLRVYRADPYLPEAARTSQRRRIANAYEALSRLPSHPNIAGAHHFFTTEEEDCYVLVTEDVAGQAMRVYLDRPGFVLTLEQKLRVATDLLTALAHAHSHQVVHRNLTPSTMLLDAGGQLHLVSFEYARAGTDRSESIAAEIGGELDPHYAAPEVKVDPAAATTASDVYSAGVILHELFYGERPDAPTKDVSRSALPPGLYEWLCKLCAPLPASRPSATVAAHEMLALLRHDSVSRAESVESVVESGAESVDYSHLPKGYQLQNRYVVEKRLGSPGSFGVVYKVIDTLGDVAVAMKIILRDRHSTLERVKKEYRALLRVPAHPNVVKVIYADRLPGDIPFILFEFIEGLDVGEMIDDGKLAPEDGLDIARQVADGLCHLHRHGLYHCDVKPSNLLWTNSGVRIIDFNVSVLTATGGGHGGGSHRYLPPDYDLSVLPTPADLADRDLYALGITVYEAVTKRYPWDAATPPADVAPYDPSEIAGFADLSPEFVAVMLRAIAPHRAERFGSAQEFRAALEPIRRVRRSTVSSLELTGTGEVGPALPVPANTNPYVSHLLTLYSQSKYTNAGTRGLDEAGQKTYVSTALDRDLAPAVLNGEFRLVLITGNAGDGKTAFLQQLERRAENEGGAVDRTLVNGARFQLHGRTYITNYDGSQDEGAQQSDDVLRSFFAPYAGESESAWPPDEVRLIAINEGRLVDFLASENQHFPLLDQLVRDGLVTGVPERGVAVVNLNLRSVVADAQELEGSILEKLVRRMVHEPFWAPCLSCDLQDRCYAFHNARTFQDEIAGPRVLERLKTLYRLTHMRARLHITLRDLRSALAFMLVGTRDCAEIHDLYRASRRDEIAQGFYFNSWMGGDEASVDRLLVLLKDVDIGPAMDPRLDRQLDFVSPVEDPTLLRFAERGHYERDLLQGLFEDLPRDFAGRPSASRAAAHQRYVAMSRRRHFFEQRDERWRYFLPYSSAEKLITLIGGERTAALELTQVLRAINRGEGLCNPDRLGGKLALQVRQVDQATIRSYRLFPSDRFTLTVQDEARHARFVEHMPTGLVLTYRGERSAAAQLLINLDVFEMLHRLNEGYRPTVEEEQGYYLSLAVFKNVLGSAPYQEVLLTTTGHDFYRVERFADGRLAMDRVDWEVS